MKRFLILVLICISIKIQAQVESEWRGINREGKYNETNLLKSWPENGPKVIFEVTGIGKGWSSAAVTKNAIFLTGRKDSLEILSALDHSGKIIWQTSFGNAWMQSFPDSRCTPTVENDNVFVTSGKGEIVCMNTKDGKIRWQVDAIKEYGAVFGEWGCSESPLIIGDKLIFTPSGSTTTMIALNKNSGKLIWKTESIKDTARYMSPSVINYKGKQLILNALSNNIIGVDASNGQIVFQYYYKHHNAQLIKNWGDWMPVYSNTMLFNDGKLYITSGYNMKGHQFKISDNLKSLEMVWEDTVLDVHHGGVVEVDGYIYGANWLSNSKGNWCCMDWKTGKKMWEETWNTKGSIIYADGLLYVYDEKNGNVGLIKANPTKFELISTFKITKGAGPHWAHPVIKNGLLYIRHGEDLVVYDIKNK